MNLANKISTIAVILQVCTGCASIVSDKRYPVSIVTEPSAAKVEVKDQYGVVKFSGTSPATAMLESGNGYFTSAKYTVTAAKDGYASNTYPIKSSLDGWYWGNILFGGLIGMLIVDPITGAMYEIDTPSIAMSLSPAAGEGTNKLRRLKALYEDGLLSEKEYKLKRKAALADM